MILNGREIARMKAGGHSETQILNTLESVLEKGRNGEPGGEKVDSFSLRDLYVTTVKDGYESLMSMNPAYGDSFATEAVDSSFFSNITGQIIYSRINQGYMSEDFVFSNLIPNIPTPFLDGEKIPGMSGIGDDVETVGEGQDYPELGFSDSYTETPRTTKRGGIVSVTREAIFADRTGLILRRASELGNFLGLNKEKRLIDIAIGATNTYTRNGTASDTYQTASPWINDQSNALTDWEELEASWLLMREMTDPDTGEHIALNGSDIVVAPAKAATLARILSATQIRDTRGTVETLSGNPVGGFLGNVRAGNSQLFATRVETQLSVSAANSKLYWIHGDFAKAFGYMEAFAMQTSQQGATSEQSFSRDIVARYKASERGAAAVLEPRAVVRNKN